MRRNSYFVLALSLLIGVLACREREGPVVPDSQTLELHAGAYFENQYLRLKLDDQLVFSGFATTLPQLGLAFIVSTTAEAGTHFVEASLGEQVQGVQFDLREKTYVVVGRDGVTGELYIRATHERPIYE